MTEPIEVPWGWETASPLDAMVNAAAAQIIAVMKTDGWSEGTTTMVRKLTTTVAQPSLKNLPAHITITKSSITDLVRNRLLTKACASAGDGAKAAVKSCPFHVTVSVGDDLYDKENPRWFSGSGTWGKAADPDAADLAAAVAEARKVLGR